MRKLILLCALSAPALAIEPPVPENCIQLSVKTTEFDVYAIFDIEGQLQPPYRRHISPTTDPLAAGKDGYLIQFPPRFRVHAFTITAAGSYASRSLFWDDPKLMSFGPAFCVAIEAPKR